MHTDCVDTGSRDPNNSETESKSETGGGLSQFALKVLDQLSITSWLPATYLVGTAILLFNLDSKQQINVALTLQGMGSLSFGALAVAFFGLVIGAMVIQAFEFHAIRALEGYWPYLWSRIGFTRWRVDAQTRRRAKALRRSGSRRKAAFEAAQKELLDVHDMDWAVVQHLRASVLGGAGRREAEVIEKASKLDWEDFSSAPLLREMEAAQRARKGWPIETRVMPTRLGNVLRSYEDKLSAGPEGLRTYAIRHWHLLSSEQKSLQARYRRRLDLYCEMVWVSVALAVLSMALFSFPHPHWVALPVSLALLAALATTCYRAAIAAAFGYGEMLKVMELARAETDLGAVQNADDPHKAPVAPRNSIERDI